MPGDDDWCLVNIAMMTQNLSHFDILRKKGARPKIFSHFGDFVIVVNVQFYDFIPS